MSQIPDKLYFKIGEVSRITKIKPYILRYWEKQFRIIKPTKSQGNQRVYTKKDVELILYIKELIDKEGYTLEGVKKKIRELARKKEKDCQLKLPFTEKYFINLLKDLRKDLCAIRDILCKD